MTDKIGHAELEIGDSLFMLADAFPDMGGRTLQSLGGAAVTVATHVEDVPPAQMAKRAAAVVGS